MTTCAVTLQSELNDWGKNPPDGCCLERCEPMTNWVIIMTGPEPAAGMPRLYEGEVFRSATAMYEHAAQHTQHSR